MTCVTTAKAGAIGKLSVQLSLETVRRLSQWSWLLVLKTYAVKCSGVDAVCFNQFSDSSCISPCDNVESVDTGSLELSDFSVFMR